MYIFTLNCSDKSHICTASLFDFITVNTRRHNPLIYSLNSLARVYFSSNDHNVLCRTTFIEFGFQIRPQLYGHTAARKKKNQRDPSLTPIFQGYFIIQFDLNTFFLPSQQTPLICHRIIDSANEKWKTETPSKSLEHNIKDSCFFCVCVLFLHANLTLNVIHCYKKSNFTSNRS